MQPNTPPTNLNQGAIEALRKLVGPDHSRLPDALAGIDPGVDPDNLGAGLWLRPGNVGELAAILRECNARLIPVVAQGGKTGLSGGAATHAHEVAVSLERLNHLIIDPVSRTAVAGAGVRLSILAAAAAEHGLSAGIDLGARDSATIGGMVSTNAGGIAAFRHGTMRERVLGLEAVLADGSVLTELGQVIKRNEGIAVERLLIGAEGTLGLITQVTLALVPLDGERATALVGLEEFPQAALLTSEALALQSVVPTALEIMSGNHATAVCRSLGYDDLLPLASSPFLLLVELTARSTTEAESALVSWLTDATDAGLVTDAVIAQSEQQRATFWRVREDWAVDRERPGGLWFDISVPLSRAADYIASLSAQLMQHDPALGLYLIGHLADGNLHVTVNASTPIAHRYAEIAPLVTDPLAALGGSYSAEHGIGTEKKSTLARLMQPTKRRLMQQIKALFDPNNILNPGKVIPD